jgi:hypothetical protein
MTKRDLDKHLRANPKAKKHSKVIKETLKALDSLKESGYGDEGYSLVSPYGGDKSPYGATRRAATDVKLTYSA